MSFLVVIIDFAVKRIIILNIKNSEGIKLFNGLIKIVYTENTGAAFGIFSNNKLFLIIFNVFIIIFLVCFVFNMFNYNKAVLFLFSLIIGGGIGNLLDRLIYGYVVDYIKLSFFSPVCNFADYCITAGTIGVIFFFLIYDKNIRGAKINK